MTADQISELRKMLLDLPEETLDRMLALLNAETARCGSESK